MLTIQSQIEEIPVERDGSIPEAVISSTQPYVLRGLVKNWPMVKAAQDSAKQAVDYLSQFSTDEPLTVYRGDAGIEGRVFYNDDFSGFNFQADRLPMAEITSQLLDNNNKSESPMLYVGSTMIDKWLPGFRAKNDLPLQDYNPLVSIWMGNQSRIAAHYDFAENIACCVTGRRRFIVFPPDQLENLYVGPLDFTPAGQPISLVDFANPDYEQYPKFREALKHAQIVELAPGDAIRIPSMWWHHVEALDSFNVLVNYWWRNSPSFMGAPLNALQHAMLGLRDLPPEQRVIWQNIFKHYVFEPKEENFAHIPQGVRGVLDSLSEESAQQIRTLLLNRLK